MRATFNIVLATNIKSTYLLHHYTTFSSSGKTIIGGAFFIGWKLASNQCWRSLGTPNSKSLWGSKWTNCGASSGERPSWRGLTGTLKKLLRIPDCCCVLRHESTSRKRMLINAIIHLLSLVCFYKSLICKANSKSHLPFYCCVSVSSRVVWYLPWPWSLCQIHL